MKRKSITQFIIVIRICRTHHF